MSITDVKKEQSLLIRIKNKTRIASVAGKIVYVPRDKVRFVCQNCKIKTVITMHESGQRDEKNKMDEITCDGCGTIYVKGDDYS